jgi:hypothetical protein
MSAFVDPSWDTTEAGISSRIDLNTKCDFEIDTSTAQKYSRDAENQLEGAKPPVGDLDKRNDKFWDE